MNLLWLEQVAAQQPALVGGKAANLSRLAAGYRVPAGFCLTTAAFERAHRGAQVGGGLPRSIYAELAAAYLGLAALAGAAAPPVAVRSSAADEDGDAASFAGQHESYLNIAGVDAIAEAVWRCWMSARAPRALAYRRERGLALDRVRLAVLIQRLVTADVAAVVFSANPLTGARDEVVINASWGLGESIAGGTVTPDTYIARKAGGALLSRVVAEKRRMTVAAPGGTREVDVPRLLQAQPALSVDQVAELAALAVSLEQRMGWPVDVECAYAGGKLYPLMLSHDELEAMGQRSQEHLGAAMARLAERWRSEQLPEIERHLAYWRSFDLRGASMAQLLDHFDQTAAEPGLLRGNAGSPGKVRGVAKVVRSLADAGKLKRDDILVAETTAPPWTPLFATAAAVITDTGGILSHCAVVAREYGIPAVVGIGMATTAIRDGQVIEVDSDAGIVRIIEDEV